MNKSLPVAAAAAVLLALAGCAAATSPARPAAVERPAEMSQAELEHIYLTVVRNAHPVAEDIADDQLLGVAYAACDALDAGVPYYKLLLEVEASGVGDEFGAFVTGAGVETFCPEHLDAVE